METTQPANGKIKKTFKFVWRHILTLVVLYQILTAIFSGQSIIGENSLGILGLAMLLDWAKQYMKFRSGSSNPYSDPHRVHPYNDIKVPLNLRQPWNPGVIGTASYESDNYPRIKRD